MGYAPPRSPDTQPVGVKKRRSPKPGPSHIIDLRPALEAVHVSSARCALAYLPWELGARPSTPEKEHRSGPPDAGLSLRSERPYAGERDAAPQKLRVSRICVEDIVSAQIDACDPLKTLPAADFCHVLSEVTDIVVRVMTEGERAVCDGEDLAFIRRRVQELVQPGPGASEGMVVYDYEQASRRGERQRAAAPSTERFQRYDHVACRLDGGTWASGVVHLHAKLPFVHVKLIDPDDMYNHGRIIAVPEGACHLQRAAVCDDSALFYPVINLRKSA